jgi:hypothetical protein
MDFDFLVTGFRQSESDEKDPHSRFYIGGCNRV